MMQTTLAVHQMLILHQTMSNACLPKKVGSIVYDKLYKLDEAAW